MPPCAVARRSPGAPHDALVCELESDHGDDRDRFERQLAGAEHRIQLQLRAIEAGVEPAVVRERMSALEAEQDEIATPTRYA